MRSVLPFLPVLSFSLSLAACGDTAGLSEEFNLVAVVGSDQTGVVAEGLEEPLRVRLIHPSGITLSGVAVEFDIITGGGTVLSDGGEPARSVTVPTDEDGFAQASWTLGTAAGEQRVVASVVSAGQQVFRVSFSATALPGPPVPTAVTADVGILTRIEVPLALRLRLRDQFNNPINGVTIDWEIAEGSGNLNVASTTTDDEGRTSTEVTPTELGPLTVTAQLGGEVLAERELFAVTTMAQDPAGDTFNAPTGRIAPDLLALGGSVVGGGLQVNLEFAQEVVLDGTGAPDEVLGVLDLDIDQDPETGLSGFAEFGEPAEIMVGDEYFVAMTANEAGDYEVFRHIPGEFAVELVGTATPNFTERLLEFAIPLDLIGDPQGPLNMAVLVGTLNGPGSSARKSHDLFKGGETIAVTDIGPGAMPLTLDIGAAAHSSR